MQLKDKCSHGKLWQVGCLECDQISLSEKLQWFIEDCEKVIRFFEESPGLTSDPRVVPHIYEAFKRLAECLSKDEAKKNAAK